ncbi:MAG TPA: hypothetical protein VD978_20330 [Azospirillum sp.]|nr:hypothetical protein [Azospirillum sp.]
MQTFTFDNTAADHDIPGIRRDMARLEREYRQFCREMDERLDLLAVAVAAGERGDREEVARLHAILFPDQEDDDE